MAMAVPAQTIAGYDRFPWDAILLQTNSALMNNTDPNVWASQIISTLRSTAVTLPSVDLAHRLVSHLFWNHHSPTVWKLLDIATSLNLLPPLLLIALLSTMFFHIFRYFFPFLTFFLCNVLELGFFFFLETFFSSILLRAKFVHVKQTSI